MFRLFFALCSIQRVLTVIPFEKYDFKLDFKVIFLAKPVGEITISWMSNMLWLVVSGFLWTLKQTIFSPFFRHMIRHTLQKHGLKQTKIRIPLNISSIPIHQLNQPPWLVWWKSGHHHILRELRSSATYDLWLKAESWSLNFKILKKIIE